jgi:uncharacterized protein (TIGR02145 family)
MKNNMHFLVAMVLATFISTNAYAQTGTMTDIRDGSVYKTVKIGNQVWMAENLHISVGSEGDSIPELITNKEWRKSRSCGWCSYKNDSENGLKYGYLYKWVAVNSCKLCPDGWHIPTYDEIVGLQKYLGGEAVAGAAMKSTSGWKKYNKRNNNSSGFTALPSGGRIYSGGFQGITREAMFWTCTRNSQLHAVYLYRLTDDSNGLRLSPWMPDGAHSVRCIKD